MSEYWTDEMIYRRAKTLKHYYFYGSQDVFHGNELAKCYQILKARNADKYLRKLDRKWWELWK